MAPPRPKQILVGPVRQISGTHKDADVHPDEWVFNVYQNLTQTRFSYKTSRAAAMARDSLLEASNAVGIPDADLEEAIIRYATDGVSDETL